MPRWASRITLEVTGVCVERLQEITEADAVKEGFEIWARDVEGTITARRQFEETWHYLNGKRNGALFARNKNPWVLVIEFKRLENE